MITAHSWFLDGSRLAAAFDEVIFAEPDKEKNPAYAPMETVNQKRAGMDFGPKRRKNRFSCTSICSIRISRISFPKNSNCG